MSLDSLQDTIQDALDASEDADFYEVERCLRQATHTVLNLRIEDHCKAKHYELALKDAHALMALDPSSPDGYAWAGKIWSDALYFSKAAETYSVALKEVKKPEAQFGPLYKEAVARRDRKVDPLGYLPGELVMRIFGYLSDMRMTCTYVSKTWRRLLLALPLWKCLEVYLTRQRASGYWQRGLEAYLQPHLEELTLSCKDNLCTVVSMLNAAECHQLRRVGKLKEK
ncbi:hypothetical protein BCR43DRAFT_266722 [Syncephalastrum racemosum]|uniref:F-box domain-containing protein n=1 Tax=Syncephalastrum racemosum TaxID=13706 RepID=A0A1X2HBK0_SYNRA|nr:hypothetical protein BCR43DRAFT_266722 [Syncephalastrum racemosum]